MKDNFYGSALPKINVHECHINNKLFILCQNAVVAICTYCYILILFYVQSHDFLYILYTQCTCSNIYCHDTNCSHNA